MKSFVITSMCLALFGVLCRFVLLSWADYPRSVSYTRGEDCFFALGGLCWSAWAAWLLLA